MKLAFVCLLGLSALSTAGCDLYFGGDDDCDDWAYGGEPGAAVPAQELRDPYTGQCIYQSSGYDPNGCGAYEGDRAPVVYYDYATCYSLCEGLDETTCRAGDSCRAIYGCRTTDASGVCTDAVFAGCWGTAPSGPAFGTPCAGLDALECSRHNDCSAVHQAYESCVPGSCTNVVSSFLYCTAEGPPPPPPPPACDTLAERGCIDREDCTPLYEGSDCTCDDLGCGCTVWTFVSCGVAG
jgi:hypothetical protein